MSPIYLNPQSSSSTHFLELKGDQQYNLQLLGHVYDLPTSSSNYALPYSNSVCYLSSDTSLASDYSSSAQVKVEKPVISYKKPSDDDLGQALTSSSKLQNLEWSYVYSSNGDQGEKLESVNNDQKHPRKWKPSKVRIVEKMMNTTTNKNNMISKNNNNDGGRVCTDCHTTTTPLWRSGPQGPKSLCNACGIRQRKARRAAMAAAINATSMSSSVEAPKHNQLQDQMIKGDQGGLGHNHKISHPLLPLKKRTKTINSYKNTHKNKKLCFEDFALSSNKDYSRANHSQGAFPRDEEEGAILLLALSCGLACSS